MSRRGNGRAGRPDSGPQPPGSRPRRAETTEEKRARIRRETKLRRRRATVLFGGAIALFIALMVVRHIHAGGDPAKAASKPNVPTSYAVGIQTCTFVDHSRSTPNFTTHTSTPGRVLVTEIRYPSLSHAVGSEIAGAAPARSFGPFPTVYFAHGYDLTPNSYARLLDTWVHAGYVVIAPLFPDTNAKAVSPPGASAPEQDDVNQPGDVAFVARTTLADAATRSPSCGVLYHLLNRGKLALAGQSDGADTVAALAYDAGDRVSSPTFRAVLDLSGQEFGVASTARDPYGATPGDPALLVVQSATDECNPPQFSTKLYDDIDQSDRWFLELKDAYHLPPYDGSDGANFAVVKAVTTKFLALEFAGIRPGASFSRLGNANVSIASLTAARPAPVLAPLEEFASQCYLEGPRR